MRRFLNFFRRIRVRLTLWYVLLLAIVLVVFSSVLYLSLKRGLVHEVDDSLGKIAAQLATNLEMEDSHPSFQNSDEAGNLLDRLAAQGYVMRLTDHNGKIIQETGKHPEVFESKECPQKGFETVRAADEKWRIYTLEKTMPGEKAKIFLQLGESLNRVESTLSKLLVLELILIPLVLTMASLGGMFLAGKALNPIKKITMLADSTEAVDLSRRLDLNLPNDELGILAKTFNGMLERLEDAFNSQRQFVSEAAHELRTPLTIMKGTTDVALGRDRTSAEYRETLEEVKSEIDYLATMVEDLLALSQADSDSAVIDFQLLDLSELLNKSVERIIPLAKEKKMIIDFSSKGTSRIRGDADKLNRLFTNILDNAIKYSPRSGRVIVRIVGNDTGVVATIEDNGPGIPSDELPNIFKRFHRGEEARKVNPSGAGLGLSIALWVARAHGGDIHVESSPGKGTTFSVILPAVNADT